MPGRARRAGKPRRARRDRHAAELVLVAPANADFPPAPRPGWPTIRWPRPCSPRQHRSRHRPSMNVQMWNHPRHPGEPGAPSRPRCHHRDARRGAWLAAGKVAGRLAALETISATAPRAGSGDGVESRGAHQDHEGPTRRGHGGSHARSARSRALPLQPLERKDGLCAGRGGARPRAAATLISADALRHPADVEFVPVTSAEEMKALDRAAKERTR